ncbi:MAG: 2-iminoacetate synthase ThiH, partial [Candidatus Omnitrophica bacterium]|nr:2-iminoacetate synthase ThiH [Candidatus Omnitrophota bacterium]
MSFKKIYNEYAGFDVKGFFEKITTDDVLRVLVKDQPDVWDFLTLLSPQATEHLEIMARKANRITLQYFGRTIQLYTPLYLSNYCVNSCSYCGFNVENSVSRKKLTLDEVKKEAEFISSTGLKHVLILTGESQKKSPVSYIKDCVGVLKNYFSSISIETYALTECEYKELIDFGVDGITIYQEVYDRGIYDKVHLAGPKKDYEFRLGAPERALKEGIRTANIGTLLGLNAWPKEVFFAGLHARYLQDKFADAEIGVSVPRMRPHMGKFKDVWEVKDKELVQIVMALRIFLPRIGIALSTREDAKFRDNLLPLGITRISAGSTTAVGGHTIGSEGDKDDQFE